MATATYTWEDLLAYLGQNVPRINEGMVGIILCNQIQNTIWDKCDWRQTISDMPPFHPILGEQDLMSPLVCPPSDFRGLRKCQAFQISSDPPITTDLNVLKDVKETWRMSLPEEICYDMARSCFRIFPRFPRGLDTSDWVIQCTYKRHPIKLTGATINTVIPFDDHYFQTLVDVGHWLAAKADPRRVREVPALQAQAEFSMEMKATEEGINLGTSPLVPEMPLDMFQGRRW